MAQNLTAGYRSLDEDINKVSQETEEQKQGVVSELMPELSVNIDEKELLVLTKQWKRKWEPVQGQLSQRQRQNEKYWKGQHFGGTHAQDNVMFEAVETFLPLATSENPDPVVLSDDTPEGIELADKTRRQLVYLADTNWFKLDIKQAVRYWLLYFVGVAKISWDYPEDDIATVILRPQKLIFDPDATIDGAEYTGKYLGEIRKDKASTLVKRFGKKSDEINKKVDGKMGTYIQYIEWWTPDVVFWEMEGEILDIKKNPHWNYDQEDQEVRIDEYGNESTETIVKRGRNHFTERKMPYVFLSVFNTGTRPFDDTTLVEQTIPLQDLVNKRQRQMDKNADQLNSGMIADANVVTKDQAAQAARALKNGEVIRVTGGATAIQRDTPAPLPPTIFQSLIDHRQELRNVFGISGSTPDGTKREQTVRGKIQIQAQDATRIGGGIAEYIEQFADQIYNWWVQMMFVYYTEEHVASVIGQDMARQFSSLRRDQFTKKLLVSVRPGSLIPKDPLIERNEAIDLWSAGALDPLTLFEKLKHPDPEKAAMRLWQWQNDPTQLVPGLAQQQSEAQVAAPIAPEAAAEVAPELSPLQQAIQGQLT